MDKVIEEEVSSGKRKRVIVILFIVIGIIAALVWLLRFSLSSSVKKSSITTAIVEVGNVENTISASGEVLPEFEEVITSPINASVQKVTMDAGSQVRSGQSVLTLDKAAAQTEYEKLKFQLESKHNDIKKLKLELNKSFYDIKSNNDVKQLRINSLEADVENTRRLFKAGGGTREDIEKAELNLKVAKLEKQQLENEIKTKQQTMQVEMREAEIAAAIQENDLRELERKLKLANIVASRDGVVTWVNKNIGANIREGDALARIADLSSFKVQGNISDNYLDQLHTGLSAIVRINETQVRGTVVNVQPSVQNSLVSFDVRLDERNNKLLRPNMKVDVYLVTASQNNILRVANGPAFKGASTQDVFVVKNNKAERRTVQIGMSNFDYVELKNNVKVGDEIIVSDMSTYKNAKELTINN
ncbi:MAG: HlyD family efflux transporter periplasmic adaptor subunit [Agriterribacter sp.]